MTPQKRVSVGQKLKLSKTYEKRLNSHIRVVERKKRLKKKNAQYLKNDEFSNYGKFPSVRRSWPCKMVSVSQKLELLKAWDNFSKFSKIGHYARAIAFAKSSIGVKY